MQGLGFRVQGSGFRGRVQGISGLGSGLGLGVYKVYRVGLGTKVWDSGLGIKALGYVGFRVFVY